jgi:hypothetical protein
MRITLAAVLIGTVLRHSRPFSRSGVSSRDPDLVAEDKKLGSFVDEALAEIPDLAPTAAPPAASPPKPRDKRSTSEIVDESDMTPPAPALRNGPAASAKKPDDAPAGPEAKPAPGAPPPEPVAPPAAGEAGEGQQGEEEDPDLEKDLAKFKAKSPQTEEGISALKKFVRERNREFKTNAKQLQDDLEAARNQVTELKNKVLPDDERARIDQMQEYVRNVAIENDPEFQQKYDQAINKIDSDLVQTLKGWGMKEQVAKVISERGGIVKFSESDAPAGAAFKNEDKSPMTEQQFFEKYVFGPLSPVQQHQVTQLLLAAKSKSRERDEEINQAKAKAPEFLKTRQEKAVKEFNNRAQARLTELVKSLPEDMPRDVMPIPKDATKEEKARLEEANKAFEEANQYVIEKVMANTPEDRAEVAFYAALGKHLLLTERGKLTKDRDDWKKRAEDAETELSEIKASSSMSRHRLAPTPKPNAHPPGKKMTTEEAVDAGL